MTITANSASIMQIKKWTRRRVVGRRAKAETPENAKPPAGAGGVLAAYRIALI